MSTQDGAGQDARGPLSDLRVVEMGQLLAGPMRQWGREKPHVKSLCWTVVARDKESVTCNLRTPEGQDLARRIIERADIVVENFRPGTLERWGLDAEGLREADPGLGEHNQEVYGDLLELKQDEIGALSVRGVI
jgi:formyl-CoA transferase